MLVYLETKHNLQINNLKLNRIIDYLKQNGVNKHILYHYIKNVSFFIHFDQSFLLLFM
jgi:hypothetical protein